MGGKVWEDREYWGEANAMMFLRDRVAKGKFHCRLFGKIKQAVEEYAREYENGSRKSPSRRARFMLAVGDRVVLSFHS